MQRRQFILSGIALAATASLGAGLSILAWQQSQTADDSNLSLVLSALLPALLYGFFAIFTVAPTARVTSVV
jgi:ABC-type phosphate transport system permease subunit